MKVPQEQGGFATSNTTHVCLRYFHMTMIIITLRVRVLSKVLPFQMVVRENTNLKKKNNHVSVIVNGKCNNCLQIGT